MKQYNASLCSLHFAKGKKYTEVCEQLTPIE